MKFLQIAILFLTVTVFAQSKVGTVDIDFIIQKMPEYTQVESDVEAYAKTLGNDLETKMAEFKLGINDFKQKQAENTDEVNAKMRADLVAKENDIKTFRENAAQLINIKQDELLRPLYQKIGTSLEKIAKAQGYSQVTQINDNIVYVDETYDLTVAILADLGVTLE